MCAQGGGLMAEDNTSSAPVAPHLSITPPSPFICASRPPHLSCEHHAPLPAPSCPYLHSSLPPRLLLVASQL